MQSKEADCRTFDETTEEEKNTEEIILYTNSNHFMYMPYAGISKHHDWIGFPPNIRSFMHYDKCKN